MTPAATSRHQTRKTSQLGLPDATNAFATGEPLLSRKIRSFGPAACARLQSSLVSSAPRHPGMPRVPSVKKRERMKHWATIGQDFAGSASAVLVVTTLTSNLQELPDEGMDTAVATLFGLIAITFLIKLGFALFTTDPRQLYKFRRPKDHRVFDSVVAIGAVLAFFKLDAASAKARMEAKIRKWMLRELSTTSSATIFTHDLSWAKPTDEPLVRLSGQGLLRIVSCTDRHSPSQLDDLRAFKTIGAKIDHWKIDAPARFTIFRKDGETKVAVALPDKRHHRIIVADREVDGLLRLALGVEKAIDGAKVKDLSGL